MVQDAELAAAREQVRAVLAGSKRCTSGGPGMKPEALRHVDAMRKQLQASQGQVSLVK